MNKVNRSGKKRRKGEGNQEKALKATKKKKEKGSALNMGGNICWGVL